MLPPAGKDSATLRAIGEEGTFTPGVEGSVLFIRLLDADGATLLDSVFEWPEHEEWIPPGRYDLVAYWRGCNGDCSSLSNELAFCHEQIEVATRGAVDVVIHASSLSPGSSCRSHVQ